MSGEYNFNLFPTSSALVLLLLKHIVGNKSDQGKGPGNAH